MFVLYVAFNYFCTVAKERTASLVVLPPLVLGYDDLYEESKEHKVIDDLDDITRLDNYGIMEMDSRDYTGEKIDPTSNEGKGPKSNEDKGPKSNEDKVPKSNEDKGPKSNEDKSPKSSEVKGPKSNEKKDQPDKDQNQNKNKSCDDKFQEVQIVGKLIVPQRVFSCDGDSHIDTKTANKRLRSSKLHANQ